MEVKNVVVCKRREIQSFLKVAFKLFRRTGKAFRFQLVVFLLIYSAKLVNCGEGFETTQSLTLDYWFDVWLVLFTRTTMFKAYVS